MWEKIHLIGLLFGNTAFYAAIVALAWLAWKKMGVMLPLFWALTTVLSKLWTLAMLLILDAFLTPSHIDSLIDKAIEIANGLKGQTVMSLCLKYPIFSAWEKIITGVLLLLMGWEDLKAFGKEPRSTSSRVAIGILACLLMVMGGSKMGVGDFQVWPTFQRAPTAEPPSIKLSPRSSMTE